VIECEPGEDILLGVPVEEVGIGNSKFPKLAAALGEQHQLFWVGIGERTQEGGVYDAEDRSVRSDAESKGENHDDGESRRCEEASKSVTEIIHGEKERIEESGRCAGMAKAGVCSDPSLGSRMGTVSI
jgi:hypothetical protein